jgi:hypothetical protein
VGSKPRAVYGALIADFAQHALTALGGEARVFVMMPQQWERR